MTDPKGFIRYKRRLPPYRPVPERLRDHLDVVDHGSMSEAETHQQSARCMGCGVPFCHDACPLGNPIPDFNAAVYRGDWAAAYRFLSQTNPFPEFTGRICPAPCENACVLNLHEAPVTIEHLERSIVEKAFENGWVTPNIPFKRNGKKVAVIGSGPAGLAAADILNHEGFEVHVYEKQQHPGGLLRYGIPDFKLEKWVIERRIELMEQAGVVFHCGVEAGVDVLGGWLVNNHDAVLLCVGAARPKVPDLPGADLPGVHEAMDYLTQGNCRVSGEVYTGESIHAGGKHVVVIGGGDTGSDCVGTANREGALSVSQLQYRPKPPEKRGDDTPWPLQPQLLSVSSSHEEGCERHFEVQSKKFLAGPDGKVNGLLVADLIWEKETHTDRYHFMEKPGSERVLPCDLALLATGYQGVALSPLWEQLGLQPDANGLLPAENYQSQRDRVFVAGDARRGQSLVVWALEEGKRAAEAIISLKFEV